jgi:RNA polymerase sigma-70 factor, ECF subfamily
VASPASRCTFFEAIREVRHQLVEVAPLGQVSLVLAGREADDAHLAGRRKNIDELDDFPRLYEAYADFVRRAVIRLGGPRADIDDLVQDVFVVAMRRRASFEGRSTVRTWLYGIAIKIVTSHRRRALVRDLFGLWPAEELRDPTTPLDVFEHRESSRIVYAILDKIGAKKRTVLILHEIEGLPTEEIAEILGIPKNTVFTRLHHARKDFLALLAKHQLRAERELATKGGA